MKNYRLYDNDKGHNHLATKTDLKDIVNIIENKMNEENLIIYLIVEHDFENDSDFPIGMITNQAKLNEFKEKHFGKVKRLHKF